jgi:V8-like Glu-specific endopeptidase
MSATSRLRNLSVGMLFIFSLASFAQEKSTPAAPSDSSLNSDWARTMYGLSKATPISTPTSVVRSDTPTPSEGMFSFDMRSRQSFHVSSGILQASPDNPGMEKGNPGTLPLSADSDESSAQKAEIAGETDAAMKKDGFTRTDIQPTHPSKILRPYTFPLRTQFLLLLRFTNPGGADIYRYCSASSVSDFHLLVAASCIYSHSAKGAGFAAEIWAWPAETDVVYPISSVWSSWPDFPYGVAKARRQTVYNAWINHKDPQWDIGFITLDRRIGDRVGWMGREWGVQATSLRLSGYTMYFDPPPFLTSFLYEGFDPGNVKSYTSKQIFIDANTQSGEEGGGVWRFDGTDRFLQGVIAERGVELTLATRLTSQINSDLERRISDDRSEIPPVDRPQLIEYVLDNSSKALITNKLFLGEKMEIKINAFNAGFIPSVGTKAAIYLVVANLKNTAPPIEDVTNKGIFIGTVDLGTLGANRFTVQTHSITIPRSVPARYYLVAWVLRSSTPQYGSDRKTALLKELLAANGLANMQLNDVPRIEGGTSISGIALFAFPVTKAVDVAFSSNNPAAQVPSSVHVGKNGYEANFKVKTTPVSSETTATITATYGGVSKKVQLTILPASSAKPTAKLTP